MADTAAAVGLHPSLSLARSEGCTLTLTHAGRRNQPVTHTFQHLSYTRSSSLPYFEVAIVHTPKALDLSVSIGLAPRSFPSNRLLGSLVGSLAFTSATKRVYGMQADDQKLSSPLSPVLRGALAQSLEAKWCIVGVGLEVSGGVFFTVNGQVASRLEPATAAAAGVSLGCTVHPSVTLRDSGQRVLLVSEPPFMYPFTHHAALAEASSAATVASVRPTRHARPDRAAMRLLLARDGSPVGRAEGSGGGDGPSGGGSSSGDGSGGGSSGGIAAPPRVPAPTVAPPRVAAPLVAAPPVAAPATAPAASPVPTVPAAATAPVQAIVAAPDALIGLPPPLCKAPALPLDQPAPPQRGLNPEDEEESVGDGGDGSGDRSDGSDSDGGGTGAPDGAPLAFSDALSDFLGSLGHDAGKLSNDDLEHAVEQLQDALAALGEERGVRLQTCALCRVEPRVAQLLPCSHTVVCGSCGPLLARCPSCRADVSECLVGAPCSPNALGAVGGGGGGDNEGSSEDDEGGSSSGDDEGSAHGIPPLPPRGSEGSTAESIGLRAPSPQAPAPPVPPAPRAASAHTGCTNAVCVRRRVAHTHSTERCRAKPIAGGRPSHIAREACTNPTCVSKGVAHTHTFLQCNVEGGGGRRQAKRS